MATDGSPAKTPETTTPRKPDLSVSARIIKDNAADWHNLLLNWESLSDAGFTTANNTASLKISLLNKDQIELKNSNPIFSENEVKRCLEVDQELESLCRELQVTLDALSKIQVKMEKLSSTTKGICELQKCHNGEEHRRPCLSHIWSKPHFYEVSRQLSDIYQKDLPLKCTVAADLAHSAERDLSLGYLCIWLYQPYVEGRSKLLLESMLCKTGHWGLTPDRPVHTNHTYQALLQTSDLLLQFWSLKSKCLPQKNAPPPQKMHRVDGMVQVKPSIAGKQQTIAKHSNAVL
ncbi:cyclin-dependent kinase 2-interacting protein-like [Thomomys bottae]